MSSETALYFNRSNYRFWVVPYVHGRLVFAEAAVRALRDGGFDTLLLDLPSFMNHNSWLDAPLASFPLVSSFLIKEDSESCSLLPLVPTDAACAAAWFAKKRALAFECVDPIAFLDRSCHCIPAVASPGDERLAPNMNIKSYFEPAWRQLEQQWKDAPERCIKNLMDHGKAVADRISGRISSGCKALFVCEYRLWWSVSKALEAAAPLQSESGGNNVPLPARSCALLLEDPFFLWSAGLFDDCLTVNKKFHESLQSECAEPFDKHEATASLMRGILEKGVPMNVGGETAEAMLRLDGKPGDKPNSKEPQILPPALFFEPIRSGLDPKAKDELAKALLDYPMPAMRDVAMNPPRYFEISTDRILPGEAAFDLPDVFHADPYGEANATDSGSADLPSKSTIFALGTWLRSVHPVITRQEAKELGENDHGFRWAVKEDYELHAQACRIARNAASRLGPQSLEDEELSEFTPIAFIFGTGTRRPRKFTVISDNNPTQRQMNLGHIHRFDRETMPPPDSVYSLFATMHRHDVVFDTHIEREWITSLTLLFSGAVMGLERYDSITKRAEEYQCRTKPQDDPDLEGFKYWDLGLAWAIKYAKKNAIAVAFQGWKPSPAVQKYARQMNKQILNFTLDVLPDGLADRLQKLHFISTPLKRHSERDRIVARFVG